MGSVGFLLCCCGFMWSRRDEEDKDLHKFLFGDRPDRPYHREFVDFVLADLYDSGKLFGERPLPRAGRRKDRRQTAPHKGGRRAHPDRRGHDPTKRYPTLIAAPQTKGPTCA